MAEDLRTGHHVTGESQAPKTPTEAMIFECLDQSNNQLYSSTSLFIWLRELRWWRVVFIVVPLVLGSLATWSLLAGSTSQGMKIFVAVCALIAGILPTVYRALKLDDHITKCETL